MADNLEALLEFKRILLQSILKRSDESITELEAAMRDLQASANEETKSSAGDKYETGRAMTQLEMEKLLQLLHDRRSHRKLIQSINIRQSFSSVQPGAFVETSAGNFFILVNAGELTIGEKKLHVISTASPLGKSLLGKKAGDQIQLNGKNISVTLVF